MDKEEKAIFWLMEYDISWIAEQIHGIPGPSYMGAPACILSLHINSLNHFQYNGSFANTGFSGNISHILKVCRNRK